MSSFPVQAQEKLLVAMASLERFSWVLEKEKNVRRERSQSMDEQAMRKRALDRLYLLIPNHVCPQKDCPFHPPAEELAKEEEELATETLTKLKEIGAGVDDGGSLSMPPITEGSPDQGPDQEDAGIVKEEFFVETGEESVSDFESVVTLDSGFGRERDESGQDLSDTEAHCVLYSPDVPRELEHIEEDSSSDERATPLPLLELVCACAVLE